MSEELLPLGKRLSLMWNEPIRKCEYKKFLCGLAGSDGRCIATHQDMPRGCHKVWPRARRKSHRGHRTFYYRKRSK